MIDDIIITGLLWYVTASCVAGALSRCYAGNLLQRVGMCFISIWSLWESFLIPQRGVDPEVLFAAVGMAAFASGTILKTYLWNHRR